MNNNKKCMHAKAAVFQTALCMNVTLFPLSVKFMYNFYGIWYSNLCTLHTEHFIVFTFISRCFHGTTQLLFKIKPQLSKLPYFPLSRTPKLLLICVYHSMVHWTVFMLLSRSILSLVEVTCHCIFCFDACRGVIDVLCTRNKIPQDIRVKLRFKMRMSVV